MKLLLDLGNTRLKWALSRGHSDAGSGILQRGVVHYDSDALAAWSLALQDQSIAQIRFSSVIATEQEGLVFAALTPLAIEPQRFCVTPSVGSLHNGYATQDTLGVDRWATAMGAWGLFGQSCLVVAAGTATTIDIVESVASDHAVYRGGLILPGLDLMLQSLHQRAARLPQAAGRYRAAPDMADNTHDAITSGVIEATCGAIERMGQRLPVGAPWVLTGGNAQQLQAVLGQRASVVEDLVLEGLALNT